MHIVKTQDVDNREHKIRLGQWRIIAHQFKPGCWEPTPECPFQETANPLWYVRRAVEAGDMIMAQRKIGPGKFALLLKPAGHKK